MNDFSTRLTAMLDDVASGINPRPDFDAVHAAGVPVVSAAQPMIGRLQRPVLGVAAATMLVVGGIAAYRVLDRGATNSAAGDRSAPFDFDARPPSWPEDPMPPAPVVVVPALDWADGAEVTETTVGDGEATSEDGAGVPIEAVAELGALVTTGDRVTQNLSGTAPDGTVVTAVAAGGPPTLAIATDGVWKLTLDLSAAERGTPIRIEVTVGDAAPFVFEVTPPEPAPKATGDPDAAEGASADPKPATITTLVPKPATTVAPAPKPAETPKPEPEPKLEPAPKPEPEPEPKPEPAPVPFTVKLVDPYQDATWLKQSFYGTAPVGARVVAATDWGSVDSVANEKGQWEMRLKLTDVPGGTVVPVVVSDGVGGVARYELVRELPEPVVKEFTSTLGDVYDNADYFKPVLYGTGEAGSVVVATSEWGRAETKVGSEGYWEIWFKMFEVPNGPVGVRVTNTVSGGVFEYSLERREAAPEQEAVAFTANAAYVECDSTPPYNDYWGTGTPGSKVKVESPYGSGYTVIGESGNWEIRVEFPEAPIGEKFYVRLSNTESGDVYDKPLTRVDAL